ASVQQTRTGRLRVTPGVDEGTPRHSRRAAAAHALDHLGRRRAEAMGVDERARQAERKVEAADPRPRRAQPRLEGSQGREIGDVVDDQAQSVEPPRRDGDRLSARRVAAEVDAGELHGAVHPSASAPTPPAMQAAPMRRVARSASPSSRPPISAANSIETSRAGATWLSGASWTA